MATVGWKIDTVGKFDVHAGNEAGLDRGMKYGLGEEVELCGKLCHGLMNCDKYLLNNVSVNLSLELSPPEFYLMRKSGNKSMLKITEALLCMDLVRVDPETCMKIERELQQQKAVYPYKKSEVRNFTIAQNANSFQLDNVAQGILPEFIIVCFVDNAAYIGDDTKNPFHFQNFKLTNFSASVNGVEIAPRHLDFDFTKTNARSSHAYFSLFDHLNVRKLDRGNQITKELYDGGMFMLGYDLTADHNSTCNNRLESGTLRLDAKFSENLSNAITVLVYLQFDSYLLIDANRVVYPQLF